MSIEGITSITAEPLGSVGGIAGSAATSKPKADFGQIFGKALKEVDSLQKDANQKIEEVMLGGENANPHSALIALERADVAFQLMSSVRMKIIRAYEEVMRTPV